MKNLLGWKVVLFSIFIVESSSRAERCHDLSVFITLNKGAKCTSRQGHVGVGIDKEFYDWGPQAEKGNFWMELFGEKGSPFDDNLVRKDKNRKGLATVEEIREFLSGKRWIPTEKGIFYNTCETYEVRASVSGDQQQALVYYWNYIYETKPYFHVLKNQCTNIAFTSLRYSNILLRGNVLLQPKHFLDRLREELKSSCGSEDGQPAKVMRLR